MKEGNMVVFGFFNKFLQNTENIAIILFTYAICYINTFMI